MEGKKSLDEIIIKWIEDTKKCIELEREEEVREYYELRAKLSDSSLEKRGFCIRKLFLVDDDSQDSFSRPNHFVSMFSLLSRDELRPHKITHGDSVVVSIPSKTKHKSNNNNNKRRVLTDDSDEFFFSRGLEGVVCNVKKSNISVMFRRGSRSDSYGQGDEEASIMEDILLSPHSNFSFTVHKCPNSVTWRRLLSGIDHLKRHLQTIHSSSQLFPLLRALFLDDPQDDFDSTSFDGTSSHGTSLLQNSHSRSLNAPQIDAIGFALNPSPFPLAVIHGPPGTGKTTTIAELIAQFVVQGKKVLATAPSNVAVDNIAEKLASHPVSLKPIRIGHPARVSPLIQSISLSSVLQYSDFGNIMADIRREIELKLRHLKRDPYSLKKSSFQQRKEWREKRTTLWSEIRELRKDLKSRERTFTRELFFDRNVVLSTCTGTSELLRILKPSKGGHSKISFDVVVVDESGQALESEVWCAFLSALEFSPSHTPLLILAGDHLQLPPTVKSLQAEKTGFGLSLLERVSHLPTFSKFTRMLTIQYRMHEAIMQFPSSQLYGGLLHAHPSVQKRTLADNPAIVSSELTRNALIFIDTAHCDMQEDSPFSESSQSSDSKNISFLGHSRTNHAEADLVAKAVMELISVGILVSNIGVIAPYTAQAQLLKELIPKKSGEEWGHFTSLEIGTVDGFQGREKDVIIVSCVRSNEKGDIGFLKEIRRLNVALTRAKSLLIVIGDSATLSSKKAPDFCSSLVAFLHANSHIYLSAHDYSNPELFLKSLSPSSFPRILPNSTTSDTTSVPIPNPKATASQKTVRAEITTYDLVETVTSFSSSDTTSKTPRHWLKFNDAGDPTLVFPAILNASQRLVVHQTCERLGLHHFSRGKGKSRQVIVSRSDKSEGVDNSSGLNNAPKTANAVPEKSSEEVLDPSLDTDPAIPRSGNDENDLGSRSQEISVSHAQPKRQRQRKKRKKKKVQVILSNQSNSKPVPPKDLDEAIRLNLLGCNQPKCSQTKFDPSLPNSNHRICIHCGLRFCLSHLLPEIHGCGESAKKKARADFIEKEMKRIRANPVAVPLKERDKREASKRLKQKIQGLSSDRMRRDPNSKTRGGKGAK